MASGFEVIRKGTPGTPVFSATLQSCGVTVSPWHGVSLRLQSTLEPPKDPQLPHPSMAIHPPAAGAPTVQRLSFVCINPAGRQLPCSLSSDAGRIVARPPAAYSGVPQSTSFPWNCGILPQTCCSFPSLALPDAPLDAIDVSPTLRSTGAVYPVRLLGMVAVSADAAPCSGSGGRGSFSLSPEGGFPATVSFHAVVAAEGATAAADTLSSLREVCAWLEQVHPWLATENGSPGEGRLEATMDSLEMGRVLEEAHSAWASRYASGAPASSSGSCASGFASTLHTSGTSTSTHGPETSGSAAEGTAGEGSTGSWGGTSSAGGVDSWYASQRRRSSSSSSSSGSERGSQGGSFLVHLQPSFASFSSADCPAFSSAPSGRPNVELQGASSAQALDGAHTVPGSSPPLQPRMAVHCSPGPGPQVCSPSPPRSTSPALPPAHAHAHAPSHAHAAAPPQERCPSQQPQPQPAPAAQGQALPGDTNNSSGNSQQPARALVQPLALRRHAAAAPSLVLNLPPGPRTPPALLHNLMKGPAQAQAPRASPRPGIPAGPSPGKSRHETQPPGSMLPLPSRGTPGAFRPSGNPSPPAPGTPNPPGALPRMTQSTTSVHHGAVSPGPAWPPNVQHSSPGAMAYPGPPHAQHAFPGDVVHPGPLSPLAQAPGRMGLLPTAHARIAAVPMQQLPFGGSHLSSSIGSGEEALSGYERHSNGNAPVQSQWGIQAGKKGGSLEGEILEAEVLAPYEDPSAMYRLAQGNASPAAYQSWQGGGAMQAQAQGLSGHRGAGSFNERLAVHPGYSPLGTRVLAKASSERPVRCAPDVFSGSRVPHAPSAPAVAMPVVAMPAVPVPSVSFAPSTVFNDSSDEESGRRGSKPYRWPKSISHKGPKEAPEDASPARLSRPEKRLPSRLAQEQDKAVGKDKALHHSSGRVLKKAASEKSERLEGIGLSIPPRPSRASAKEMREAGAGSPGKRTPVNVSPGRRVPQSPKKAAQEVGEEDLKAQAQGGAGGSGGGGGGALLRAEQGRGEEGAGSGLLSPLRRVFTRTGSSEKERHVTESAQRVFVRTGSSEKEHQGADSVRRVFVRTGSSEKEHAREEGAGGSKTPRGGGSTLGTPAGNGPSSEEAGKRAVVRPGSSGDEGGEGAGTPAASTPVARRMYLRARTGEQGQLQDAAALPKSASWERERGQGERPGQEGIPAPTATQHPGKRVLIKTRSSEKEHRSSAVPLHNGLGEGGSGEKGAGTLMPQPETKRKGERKGESAEEQGAGVLALQRTRSLKKEKDKERERGTVEEKGRDSVKEKGGEERHKEHAHGRLREAVKAGNRDEEEQESLKQRDRERDRQKEKKEKERDRDRDREKDRARDKDKEKDRERARDKEKRPRERERASDNGKDGAGVPAKPEKSSDAKADSGAKKHEAAPFPRTLSGPKGAKASSTDTEKGKGRQRHSAPGSGDPAEGGRPSAHQKGDAALDSAQQPELARTLSKVCSERHKGSRGEQEHDMEPKGRRDGSGRAKGMEKGGKDSGGGRATEGGSQERGSERRVREGGRSSSKHSGHSKPSRGDGDGEALEVRLKPDDGVGPAFPRSLTMAATEASAAPSPKGAAFPRTLTLSAAGDRAEEHGQQSSSRSRSRSKSLGRRQSQAQEEGRERHAHEHGQRESHQHVRHRHSHAHGQHGQEHSRERRHEQSHGHNSRGRGSSRRNSSSSSQGDDEEPISKTHGSKGNSSLDPSSSRRSSTSRPRAERASEHAPSIEILSGEDVEDMSSYQLPPVAPGAPSAVAIPWAECFSPRAFQLQGPSMLPMMGHSKHDGCPSPMGTPGAAMQQPPSPRNRFARFAADGVPYSGNIVGQRACNYTGN